MQNLKCFAMMFEAGSTKTVKSMRTPMDASEQPGGGRNASYAIRIRSFG